MTRFIRTALLSAAAALSLAACSETGSAAPKPQTAAASASAAPAVKAEGLWVDVRTAEEFAAGYLEGALNIPVEEITARIATVSPDKNAPIHLYCRSGSRAQVALEALQQMGYTDVTNHGGYEDLRRQGLQ
ncbi:phage shock protein E [Neisseria sp. HSC-16F19]|nr:rhodanese-like domain-containing protein [Neisseria sp. HSC-16F19]MCP2041086.1 phage shock protein E [Neisseria sp. HSC-16F19]